MADRLPSLGRTKPHVFLYGHNWWKAVLYRGISYYMADGATPAQAFHALTREKAVQALLAQRAAGGARG